MAELRLVGDAARQPDASRKAWGLVIDAIDKALAIPGGIEHEGDRMLLASTRRHAATIGRYPAVREV